MVTSIDRLDATHSQLRRILSRALSSFEEVDLIELLAEDDVILRTLAARQLHVSGSVKSFESALALVIAERFEHREIGAFLLGQLGLPKYPFANESLGPIGKLLHDPYYEVRSTAVGAFGFLLVGGQVLPKLILTKVISLAGDSAPSVRESVSFTLGFCRDESALLPLKELSLDIDYLVRDAAEFATEQLTESLTRHE